jgi:HAMP domain-containing protein
MASLFRSLQARLIFSFVLVTAVALAVAAGVFVAARKEDQERQELDRVAALSPGVVRELFLKAGMDPERFSLERFADEMSELHHVRILVFGPDQVVTADSGKGLVGEVVALPSQGEVRLGEGGEPYFAFQTPNGTATDNLVLVEASLPEFGAGQPGGPPSMQGVRADRVVLAVPESTITRAWLDLLPALGVAAGVAFPVAILLAILLARSIARPVHQLTVASRQVSEGSFDVTVQTGRQDEIGQLSDAFAAMAHRVGATQSQMRQLVANVSHDLKTP